jgi:hypothetical protein
MRTTSEIRIAKCIHRLLVIMVENVMLPLVEKMYDFSPPVGHGT